MPSVVSHRALADFLGDFQHQRAVTDLGGQSVLDIGQFTFELHVDNSAQNLRDAAGGIVCHVFSQVRSISAWIESTDSIQADEIDRSKIF
jgi:hypothetical protein